MSTNDKSALPNDSINQLEAFFDPVTVAQRAKERKEARFNKAPLVHDKDFMQRRIAETHTCLKLCHSFLLEQDAMIMIGPDSINAFMEHPRHDGDPIKRFEFASNPYFHILDDSTQEHWIIASACRFNDIHLVYDPAAKFPTITLRRAQGLEIELTMRDYAETMAFLESANMAEMAAFTFLYFTDQLTLLESKRGQGEKSARFLPIYSAKPINEFIWYTLRGLTTAYRLMVLEAPVPHEPTFSEVVAYMKLKEQDESNAE